MGTARQTSWVHTHTDLAYFAKVSATPLPPPSDPNYQLLLQAQANAELKRRDARALAESDLYYFAREVLGYSDFHEPLHRPLCEFIQQPTKQLTLIPRGHFKSTIISVSYPLWLLVQFPDTRILIANATLDNPKKWVQEQLLHLRSNEVWVVNLLCSMGVLPLAGPGVVGAVAHGGLAPRHTGPAATATAEGVGDAVVAWVDAVVGVCWECHGLGDRRPAAGSSRRGHGWQEGW